MVNVLLVEKYQSQILVISDYYYYSITISISCIIMP